MRGRHSGSAGDWAAGFYGSGIDSSWLSTGLPRAAPDRWKSGQSGDWASAANWTAGVPTAATNAKIAAAGAYTVAVDSADSAHGLLLDDGAATLAVTSGGTLSIGTMLAVEAGTLSMSGGTIQGGTLNVGSGGLFAATSGTLSGVSVSGTLGLTADGAILDIYGGLGIPAGAASVLDVTGSGSILDFFDLKTLDHATVNFGSSDRTYASLYFDTDTGLAGTTTLGSHLAINGTGAYAQIQFNRSGYGDTLINQGTITADTGRGRVSINDASGNGTFINLGILVATNSGTLVIQTGTITTAEVGDFSTTGYGIFKLSVDELDDNGATLTLGLDHQLTLDSYDKIEGGTIIDTGYGLIDPYGTLSGVTYVGTLNLTGNDDRITVENGLSVLDTDGSAGVVNLTDSSGYIDFFGSQTFDDATVNIGADSSTEYIDFFSLGSSTNTITLGSQLSIVSAGFYGQLQMDFESSIGTLINAGTITADVPHQTLSISGLSGTFIDTGTLVATNSGTILFDSVSRIVAFGNLSSNELSGGIYEADAKSLLLIDSLGTVQTLAADLTLSGLGSALQTENIFNETKTSIDSSLYAIAQGGTLNLLAGRSFVAAANGGTLTDAGVLNLGGGNFAATSLMLSSSGTLEGFGSVAGLVTDAGSITSTGGTLVLSGVLNATGTLSAATGATLDLAAGGTIGPGAMLAGAGTLRLDGAFAIGPGAADTAASVIETGNVTLGSGETLQNLAGDSWSIAAAAGSAATLSGAGTFSNAGSFLLAGAGSASVSAAFVNTGTLSVSSGATVSFQTKLAGSGKAAIGANATLSLLKGAAAGQVVDFQSATGGALDLMQPSLFAGQIADFAGADVIDLLGTPATSLSYQNGVLTVLNGTAIVASLTFEGSYTQQNFALAPDAAHGSQITFHT